MEQVLEAPEDMQIVQDEEPADQVVLLDMDIVEGVGLVLELGCLNYFLEPTSRVAWSHDDEIAWAADLALMTEADLYGTMNDSKYSWLNQTMFSALELECLRSVAGSELWDRHPPFHIAPSSSRAWV